MTQVMHRVIGAQQHVDPLEHRPQCFVVHRLAAQPAAVVAAAERPPQGLVRFQRIEPGHDDHPVFYGQHRAGLSRGGIAWIIRKYQAQIHDPPLAGNSISPHILRHSKAMHLYEAGVPLPYIRDILGHVDLSTTEIYARASTEAKRKALEAAYPGIVTGDLPEWNQ